MKRKEGKEEEKGLKERRRETRREEHDIRAIVVFFVFSFSPLPPLPFVVVISLTYFFLNSEFPTSSSHSSCLSCSNVGYLVIFLTCAFFPNLNHTPWYQLWL
eukprot:TRINITY_DN12717_c0_g1_i1.p1 TRINITY_DN12717_c0_g1~~TRINITY_DN12717_c0_g1_i1.p1  ORF type:complete len:102 (+),score=5.64 TRINITY_DN12717_c0_g1_i1:338-643(+)